MKRGALAVMTAALALLATQADALVSTGSLRPVGRVFDADDRALDLRSINGKPILVLYEDKDSAKLNEPFKLELSRLAKGDRYRAAVALVPIADVQSFDFWPVRGFVKDSIRSESRKHGATIYCDWDGNLQRAAGFKRGTSSVLLIGRDARVLFSYEGAIPAPERDRLLSLLKTEVDTTE